MLLIVRQDIYYFCSLILTIVTITIAVFVGVTQISINKKLTEIQADAYLRPVILRNDSSKSWGSFKPFDDIENIKDPKEIKDKYIFEYVVLKNIAKDIKGEVVRNKYKYKLHFFNDISQANNFLKTKKIECEPKWGWTTPESKLYAFYSKYDKEPTDEENHVLLNYQDIQGNRYTTYEGKNTSICASK